MFNFLFLRFFIGFFVFSFVNPILCMNNGQNEHTVVNLRDLFFGNRLFRQMRINTLLNKPHTKKSKLCTLITQNSNKLIQEIRDEKKIKFLVENEHIEGFLWLGMSAMTGLSCGILGGGLFKYSGYEFTKVNTTFIASSVLGVLYMFNQGLTKIRIRNQDIKDKIEDTIAMNREIRDFLIPEKIFKKKRGWNYFFYD